jgi:hypothetical protein
MRELLDLIDSGINLFVAEQMLDGPAEPGAIATRSG